MVRRTKEEAQVTRAQILEAAEQAFYERGVARTTLADIATLAGVTRGARGLPDPCAPGRLAHPVSRPAAERAGVRPCDAVTCGDVGRRSGPVPFGR